MAKISGEFVRRTISMYGVEGDVVVILSAAGIELKPRGGKLGLTATAAEVAKAMREPESVPAKYQHDPYGYLEVFGSPNLSASCQADREADHRRTHKPARAFAVTALKTSRA